MTFQSLGGLGLLLGTFGLAAVQLRHVLERRGQLALRRSGGFRRPALAVSVTVGAGLLVRAGSWCRRLRASVALSRATLA